jgi:hypothetical protein
MHTKEIVNMALTASSVAESLGFSHTALAFASLAANASLHEGLQDGASESKVERLVVLPSIGRFSDVY